jgi:hypothetical protein
MSHDLPARRNLESFKKEAKRWLSALESGDAEARARFERATSRVPAAPSLRDVQHALARENGFAGWLQLRQSIDRRLVEINTARANSLALYEAKAAALLDAYRTGAPEAMERHYSYTWHRRAWRAMRTYVQLDLGRRPAHADDPVEITLDDARHLIAVEHGFANWREVEAFVNALRPGRRVTSKPLRLVVRSGGDGWQPVAASRDWEEVIDLLAEHPTAGLSGEGQMTDDLLEDLSHRRPGLHALGLSGCRQITDAGVRHLARFPALQRLDLSGTGVTDAGLHVLRELPDLRSLSLTWNRVTPDGIGALAHCERIEALNLGGPPEVGDAAARALAGKRHLRHLRIAMSDLGLPLLHSLPVFKSWQGGEAELGLVGHTSLPNELSLRGTFTDAGMTQLRGLDGVFKLDIDDSHLAITAAGMEPLISLVRSRKPCVFRRRLRLG